MNQTNLNDYNRKYDEYMKNLNLHNETKKKYDELMIQYNDFEKTLENLTLPYTFETESCKNDLTEGVNAANTFLSKLPDIINKVTNLKRPLSNLIPLNRFEVVENKYETHLIKTECFSFIKLKPSSIDEELKRLSIVLNASTKQKFVPNTPPTFSQIPPSSPAEIKCCLNIQNFVDNNEVNLKNVSQKCEISSNSGSTSSTTPTNNNIPPSPKTQSNKNLLVYYSILIASLLLLCMLIVLLTV